MSATEQKDLHRKKLRNVGGVALASVIGFAGAAWAAPNIMPHLTGASARQDRVVELLKARLPKTQVTKVNCEKVNGLCEVTAGSTLFYVDASARFLVIGRVYDMQTQQDLTAVRLLEMNPDMLVGGAAKAANAGGEGEKEAPISRSAKTPPPAIKHLDLSVLPQSGAIAWGNPSGTTVTVFSDFRCSYCRALSNTLREMNVRVVERPISTLGGRDLADQVYCAKNREKALHQAYAGEPVKSAGSCDTAGLDANEKFARSHGLAGTPVIVRSDGAVIEGYRPKEYLKAWIDGGRS